MQLLSYFVVGLTLGSASDASLHRVLVELGLPEHQAEEALKQGCAAEGVRCNAQGHLVSLALPNRSLRGRLSKEVGELQWLQKLDLRANQLKGEIPKELGQLEALEELDMSGNLLNGHVPKELGRLKYLCELHLNNNSLNGDIPMELSQLQSLRVLGLEGNQLSGNIPREFRQLQLLRVLDLSGNQLDGEIPKELGQLQALEELHLTRNQLTGDGRSISVLMNSNVCLEVLDLSYNLLSGELDVDVSVEAVRELQHLDLSHNKFVGDISRLVDPFCKSNPVGGSLQELRLNHNELTGEVPLCLMQFQKLNFLALNNNWLQGSLPEVNASELVVLSLHKNKLSGVLPKSLHQLSRLGVLTLHKNSMRGSIGGLRLSSAQCMDNSKFRMEGLRCEGWRRSFEGLQSEEVAEVVEVDRLRQLEANCPTLFGCLRSEGTAFITLHRNRFSCAVPKNIATGKVTVVGLVIMGNMLGVGQELNSSWIQAEEKQSFLYYSREVEKSNFYVLCGFVVLLFFAALCYPQRRRLHQASRNLDFDSTACIASSSFALLKVTGSSFWIASPLLLIYVCFGVYYECSPPLWQTTAANFESGLLPDLAVVACWSALLVLFRAVFAGMPMQDAQQVNENMTSGRPGGVLVWGLWVFLVTIFSLPSILFAFAQSLPAHNTSGLSEEFLSFVHKIAPVLTVLIDMVVAVPMSTQYSAWSGLKTDRLLMTFRLFSAWLLPLITTVILDENCISGWKWTWTVCQAGSSEHRRFDWSIYDQEILSAQRSICNLSLTWWSDGRCSRAIIGNLTPFLLKKLLTRCTIQPLILWLQWQVSRLEHQDNLQRGRHLRLLGIGPKTSGFLAPLQQMSWLTTQLELLAFWTPFIPLLSLGILSAGIANLLMFDLGIWGFGVTLPSDSVNKGAAVSGSYLRFALGAGCCFQLWYAFSTRMYGRYVLLIFSLTVMGPWAKYFLPLDVASRHFWRQESEMEVNEFEMSEVAPS